MQKIIYLDYNSTTPLDPRALEAMLPYYKENFGNPASQHPHGWKASEAVTRAREQVAHLLSCKPSEIIFTSGATESNNWALTGLFEKFKETSPQEDFHVLSSRAEHKSVLKTLEHLEKWGAKVDLLPVNSYGQLEVKTVQKALRPTTRLLTTVAINNELGTINPIAELGALAKSAKVYFHCDATQGAGKIPLSVNELGVDLLSLSSHKFYGPQGVGALYIRSQNPKVQLTPLLLGGGQEKGLRSTTLNVAGIVGFGVAAELAQKEMATEVPRIAALRDLLFNLVQQNQPSARFNGHPTERSCNTLSLTLPGVSSDALIARTVSLCMSQGSACQSGNVQSSHILASIGMSEQDAHSTVRVSLGRFTTEDEVREAAKRLSMSTETLRPQA